VNRYCAMFPRGNIIRARDDEPVQNRGFITSQPSLSEASKAIVKSNCKVHSSNCLGGSGAAAWLSPESLNTRNKP